MSDRRALLTAALGFLQLRHQPPEVAPLRQWLDSWRGVRAIVTGLNAQGLDLRQFPGSWRANLYPTGTAHSIVVASAWEPTPWRAVQQAGWTAEQAEMTRRVPWLLLLFLLISCLITLASMPPSP